MSLMWQAAFVTRRPALLGHMFVGGQLDLIAGMFQCTQFQWRFLDLSKLRYNEVLGCCVPRRDTPMYTVSRALFGFEHVEVQ